MRGIEVSVMRKRSEKSLHARLGLFSKATKALVSLGLAGLGLASLGGCASVDFQQTLSTTNQQAADFTQGQLALVQSEAQRVERERSTAEILQKPLTQDEAVRLMLLNSPALQALLAQQWAHSAGLAQSARIANPRFTFERLRLVDELEIGRLLSFGLLDLLTLPQRVRVAQQGLEQQQVQLTSQVVAQITQVRFAWVNAVAAQQSQDYAAQVKESTQASAELARRMEAAGNFSARQRTQQQLLEGEAHTQWLTTQHQAVASREALVRLLGLNDAQAAQLQLPERLPHLPAAPRSTEEVSQTARALRLDVQAAQHEYQAAAQAQGLNALTSLTDIELGVRRDTVFDNAAGSKNTRRGFEISVELPLFDAGGVQRDAMNAQTLAAANQLEAALRAANSHVRESYSAYRSSFEIVQRYQQALVPQRQQLSQQNLLRYNGMLIGVFELLADAREQVQTVQAALQAEQQFWLADAALRAATLGQPVKTRFMAPAANSAADSPAGH